MRMIELQRQHCTSCVGVEHDVGVAKLRLCLVRGLIPLRPVEDVVEVAALVHRVEDGEDVELFPLALDPALPEHADVARAHELLAHNVHAVIYRAPLVSPDGDSERDEGAARGRRTYRRADALWARSSGRLLCLNRGSSRRSRVEFGGSCSVRRICQNFIEPPRHCYESLTRQWRWWRTSMFVR